MSPATHRILRGLRPLVCLAGDGPALPPGWPLRPSRCAAVGVRPGQRRVGPSAAGTDGRGLAAVGAPTGVSVRPPVKVQLVFDERSPLSDTTAQTRRDPPIGQRGCQNDPRSDLHGYRGT